MMKKVTLFFLFASCTWFASAQTNENQLTKTDDVLVPVAPDSTKSWKWSGLYNAAMTQTSLTNWAAGGTNTTNINGLIKQLGVYTKRNWIWYNLLEANFGYNFQPGNDIKTDDRLEFTSRLDRKLSTDSWRLSLFVNFRTQFADGFQEPNFTTRISTIMSPAYLTYGLGLTNTSIKGLYVYFSPVQVKQTFVLDPTLAENGVFYRIEAPNVGLLSNGGSYRTELGLYLDLIYKKQFSEQLLVTSRLNLFSNYLDQPQNIDVNWEMLAMLKVYKRLTVSLALQLIYDDDVNVKDTKGDGINNAPGVQFKQILGVGFGYSFGTFKK